MSLFFQVWELEAGGSELRIPPKNVEAESADPYKEKFVSFEPLLRFFNFKKVNRSEFQELFIESI